MGYVSLIVFLTRRCRSGCPTCNVSATPESGSKLSKEQLDALFSHPRLSGSGIRHVVWTGGEPFENFDSLEYGLGKTALMGWDSEILTAGYWFPEQPGLLQSLLKYGGFSLRLSVDREHLEATGIETLLDLAGECIALNIPLNFTVRNIPGDSTREELFVQMEERYPAFVRERKKDPRWVHRIPHIPVGGDDPYFRDGGSPSALSGCAMAFRDLVMGWDGNFYPCCGLFSLQGFEKYALNSVKKPDSTGGRVEELFALVKEKGPEVIREMFGSSGQGWKSIPYQNNCHACLDLLKEYDEPVSRYLEGETFRW